MKRIVALIFVLVFLPVVCIVEQSEFDVIGEWYCAPLYKDDFGSAVENEEGDFIVDGRNGVIKYCRGGRIEYPGETWQRMDGTEVEEPGEVVETEYCILSDQSLLFYDEQDHELIGYWFVRSEDGWIWYYISSAQMVLLLNGNIINREGGGSANYLLSGNYFYIASGDNYVRGLLRQIGDLAFAFDVDAEPRIETYGDVEVNFGTPLYLFISTSVGKIE